MKPSWGPQLDRLATGEPEPLPRVTLLQDLMGCLTTLCFLALCICGGYAWWMVLTGRG